MKKGMDP